MIGKLIQDRVPISNLLLGFKKAYLNRLWVDMIRIGH